MRKLGVSLGCAFAVAMLVSVAACGKSDGPSSPAAPSQSGATGSFSGATIAGTVMFGATTASAGPVSFNSRAMAGVGSGVTVTVQGTSITATADGSGRFTLANVPTGNITLVFRASGIEASVTVSGVNTADQIRITVVVSGNTAEIDEHEHSTANNQTEVEGRVTATSCTASPQTITVGATMPKTVNVQNAKIHHDATTLTCAQIMVNDRVEVHGSTSGTTIVATDVEVETAHTPPPGTPGHDDDEDQEAEVKGTVGGAAVGHACPAFTFTVGSTTVTTSAATKFEDTTCVGVVNGIRVEVDGTKTGPNAISAKKVQKED